MRRVRALLGVLVLIVVGTLVAGVSLDRERDRQATILLSLVQLNALADHLEAEPADSRTDRQLAERVPYLRRLGLAHDVAARLDDAVATVRRARGQASQREATARLDGMVQGRVRSTRSHVASLDRRTDVVVVAGLVTAGACALGALGAARRP